MPVRTSRTPKNTRARDWAPKFLEAFERLSLVSEAAKEVGIGRRTAYDRRDSDAQFREAWDDIVERSVEIMEREAYRRAVLGVDKPVFQGGEMVGKIRERSDTLLMFLLKARRPAMYRERVEHSGPGGGPIEHRAKLDLSSLTDEQLAVLEAIQPHDAGADPD